MKKILNIFVVVIISVLLTACANSNNTNEKPENKVTREELNNTLIATAKEKYDNIKYDKDTTILLSIEDMEKVYKLDISEFKKEELGCNLKMSYVKIEVKNNKKTYSTNLNCSGLAK